MEDPFGVRREHDDLVWNICRRLPDNIMGVHKSFALETLYNRAHGIVSRSLQEGEAHLWLDVWVLYRKRIEDEIVNHVLESLPTIASRIPAVSVDRAFVELIDASNFDHNIEPFLPDCFMHLYQRIYNEYVQKIREEHARV